MSPTVTVAVVEERSAIVAYVSEDPKTKQMLRDLVEQGETLTVFEMGDTPVEQWLAGKVMVEGPQDPDAEEHWSALVQVDEKFHITKVAA